MALKIGNDLKPEQIQTTIDNIRNSSNNLVKKILAEETTYKEECENLKTYDKEEFYQKRDKLVDALNHYTFNDNISEDEKNKLNYELFHKELKKLKQKIKKRERIRVGGVLGGLPGLGAYITGFALGEPITVFIGLAFMVLSPIALGLSGRADKLEKNPPKKFLAMKTYYKLINKSRASDTFMEDLHGLAKNFESLKEHALLYAHLKGEDSDSIYRSKDSDS